MNRTGKILVIAAAMLAATVASVDGQGQLPARSVLGRTATPGPPQPIPFSSVGPVTPEQFGAIGDGTANDTPALTAMFASNPASVYLSKTYLVASPLTSNAGYIFGGGTLKVAATYNTGGFLKAVLNNSASNFIWDGFTIDGTAYSANGGTTAIAGVGGFLPFNNGTLNNITITNVTYSCMAWQTAVNSIVVMNPYVTGCGFGGIDFSSGGTQKNHAQVIGGFVGSTGTTAISFDNVRGGGVVGVHLDRTNAPPILYGPMGPSQIGGFIGLLPSDVGLVISGNYMNNNLGSTAGGDCILLGETPANQFQATTITGNTLVHCAGYGIDVASNFTVTGNQVINSVSNSIAMTKDLGGPTSNVTVTGNTVLNPGSMANPAACIAIGSTAGPANTFSGIKVTENKCLDDRGASAGMVTCIAVGLDASIYTDILDFRGNGCKGNTAAPVIYTGAGTRPTIRGVVQPWTPQVTWTGGGTPASVTTSGTSFLGTDFITFNANISHAATNGATGLQLTLPAGRTAADFCVVIGKEFGRDRQSLAGHFRRRRYRRCGDLL